MCGLLESDNIWLQYNYFNIWNLKNSFLRKSHLILSK